MTDEAARVADKWGKDEKRLMEERSPDFRRALFSLPQRGKELKGVEGQCGLAGTKAAALLTVPVFMWYSTT